MYYATHILYLSKENLLKLHVVEVADKKVLSFFPFDGEREAMLWTDALVLTNNPLPSFVSNIEECLPDSFNIDMPYLLFAVEKSAKGFILKKIC